MNINTDLLVPATIWFLVRGFRFCVCLLVILTGGGLAHAQFSEKAELDLNAALSQYKSEIGDLHRSRGLSPSAIIKQTVVDDAAFLLNGAQPIAHDANISREDISISLRDYPEDTAVLFYSYLGETLRMWLIDKNGIIAYQKSETSRSDLNAAITNLRKSMKVNLLQLDRAPHLRSSTRKSRRARRGSSVRRSTEKLSSLLLPRGITNELGRVKHLLVAPVMGIGTVPFAMLQPFGDRTCLIERMSVSIVPSVYDVLDPIDEWRSDFHAPLIVGNPYFPPDEKWVVPQLPGAEDEARYVSKAFNTKALIGRMATKDAVIANARNADFLYFATHGIANSDNPLSGGFLLLSAGHLTQGWWTAKEIQQSNLKARLAVLSACQTGLGRVHDAGVIGLSRAFQIAGVPRVAMSLWSVDDKATAELMKSFVDYLRGNVPTEALRLAMLDLKKRQPNPTKWAAFVMFGTSK